MNIWIDGDACPKQIKQIVYRAAMKRGVLVCIVANHLAIIPSSPFIKRVLVESGFDAADTYIVNHVQRLDLVITADILLADHIIQKGALGLNPRGTLYSVSNIKQMVAVRNMNESLRSSGLIQSGQSQFHQKDVILFSNQLDRIITTAS